MKNLSTLLLIPILFCVGACTTLEDVFGEGTVLTTADQIREGGEYAVIPTDQLPEEVTQALPEGEEVVVAGREDLVEDASYVPTGGVVDDQAVEGIVKTVFGIGEAFLPGLAAWEGVALLLSRRKRKHYAKAVKAAVPTDKKIDLGEAAHSVAAALGLSHSSPESEQAFEAPTTSEVIEG